MTAMTGTAGNVTEKEKLLCAQNVQECSTKDVLAYPMLTFSDNLSVLYVR